MKKIVFALSASMMLLSGCATQKLMIPDPGVPHRVSKETKVEIYIRAEDGQMVKQEVRLLEGWWIAGPPAVE